MKFCLFHRWHNLKSIRYDDFIINNFPGLEQKHHALLIERLRLGQIVNNWCYISIRGCLKCGKIINHELTNVPNGSKIIDSDEGEIIFREEKEEVCLN